MNGYKNSSETLNGEVDNFENVDWVNPSVDWVKEVKFSIMAIRVVEFSNGVYKIGKIFA